ncbi:MAG: GNAT family N-acetyltransferase [Rhodospirillales bacterium]|jgi:ribosomal protein S18 acetylase RimI-like enzyme|nr:GNAT family N-acetyltransferase [Rhodospirillales bacterium]
METSPSHPLDRAIWESLGSHHARFAEATPLARRYRPEFGPLAAVAAPTVAAFAMLCGLIPPGGAVALFRPEPLPSIPAGYALAHTDLLLQMTGDELDPAPDAVAGAVVLGPADAPEMAGLAVLTEPGPFAPRTGELGRYLGIRAGGRLVALAGERLRLDGFTEISAVCTHPDHRGRGHAAGLVVSLGRSILARGDVPFLHVREGNHAAIGLYRRLGFSVRRRLHLAVLAAAPVGDPPPA